MSDQVQLFLLLIQVPGAFAAAYWLLTKRPKLLHAAVLALLLSGWPRRYAWITGSTLPEWMQNLVVPLVFGSALLVLIWFLREAARGSE